MTDIVKKNQPEERDGTFLVANNTHLFVWRRRKQGNLGQLD